MSIQIQEFIAKPFLLFGLKVSRINKLRFIRKMDIRTVIDVGAHKGESALEFHKLLPNAKIYSFEPLHDCFIQLNNNLKQVLNFESFNVALGDKEGKLNMHRSAHTPSSSLRKMGSIHKEAFPLSISGTQEEIHITTLDKVCSKINLDQNILLKIDVQGYEDNVIKGAQKTLDYVKMIIIETSFYELYEGQPLFNDIHNMLYEKGFYYTGCSGQLRDPFNDTPLQQDSVFIRKPHN